MIENRKDDRVTLVTGAAGFIGFHVCRKLLDSGEMVIGVDNLNPYYDVSLKKARLGQLEPYEKFLFFKEELQNLEGLKKIPVFFKPRSKSRCFVQRPHDRPLLAAAHHHLVGFTTTARAADTLHGIAAVRQRLQRLDVNMQSVER